MKEGSNGTTPQYDQANPAQIKEQLIATALATMREANEIDERNSQVADWTAWYDRVAKNTTDLEILCGAMRVEQLKRLGEIIIKQGELRGAKPGTNNKEVKTDSVSQFTDAEWQQRRKARIAASDPDTVDHYVSKAIDRGVVPSKRGAIKAVRAKRDATKKDNVQRPPKAEKDKAQQRPRDNDPIVRVYNCIAQFADGEFHDLASRNHYNLIPGMPEEISTLRAFELIPWITIERDSQRFKMTIDREFRAYCEERRPRAELGNRSIRNFLKQLVTEIQAHKRAHEERMAKLVNWGEMPDSQRERQKKELNWIESQLEACDSEAARKLHTEIRTRRQANNEYVKSKNEAINRHKQEEQLNWIESQLVGLTT